MATTSSALLIACHDGLGEAVTPTCNIAAASGDFGLANLRDSRLFHRWRGVSGSLTDVQLTWDFGAAVAGGVFALFGTNLTAAATRRYRAASDSGFTASVEQSGTGLDAAFDSSLGALLTYVPPWGRSLIYVHGTDFSRRYHRIHLTDAANPANFLEAGVGRIGTAWQPGKSFDHAWRAVDKRMGPVGAQTVLRGHELQLRVLSQAEAYKLAGLARVMLGNRRVLVIPEPLAPATWPHDALWCVLEEDYVREPRTGSAPTNRLYTVSLTFREVDE